MCWLMDLHFERPVLAFHLGVKETRGPEPVQTTCSPTCCPQRKQAERLGRSQTQQALSSMGSAGSSQVTKSLTGCVCVCVSPTVWVALDFILLN